MRRLRPKPSRNPDRSHLDKETSSDHRKFSRSVKWTKPTKENWSRRVSVETGSPSHLVPVLRQQDEAVVVHQEAVQVLNRKQEEEEQEVVCWGLMSWWRRDVWWKSSSDTYSTLTAERTNSLHIRALRDTERAGSKVISRTILPETFQTLSRYCCTDGTPATLGYWCFSSPVTDPMWSWKGNKNLSAPGWLDVL